MRISNRLLSYILRKKRLVNYFYSYHDYLENGHYQFDKSLTFIYKRKPLEQSNQYHFNTEVKGFFWILLTRCIRFFIFRQKLVISSSNKKFKGEIFLPANNHNLNADGKIFDYKHNKVLAVFSDVKDKIREVEDYNFYSKFFNMPVMISSDDNFIEYELVDHIKKDTIDTSMIIKAFEKYIESLILLAEYSKSNDLFKIEEETLTLNENDDSNNILETVIYPKIKVHNDMWTSNVLILKDRTTYMFIDWEHAGYNFVLFDFFWWAQNEFIHNNNPYLLSKILSGEFNSHFRKIFEIFGIDFRDELIEYYYQVFVVSTIKNKYSEESSITEQEAFIKQCKFVISYFE